MSEQREGRSLDATTVRPNRVRCVHCGMPVRGNLTDCWSCGLPSQDPTATAEPGGSAGPSATAVAPPRHRVARWVIVAAGACAGLLLLVLAIRVAVPTEHHSTVRRLIDRVQGEEWQRLTTPAFSIDLPGPGAETVWPAAPGHPATGKQWLATAGDVTARVAVAPLSDTGAALEGKAAASALLGALADELRGTATDQRAVTMLGAVGMEATITTPDGHQSHARAVVIAGDAYVLVLRGQADDFHRMTESFRLRAS